MRLFFPALLLLLLVPFSAFPAGRTVQHASAAPASFRDIPGITREESAAIEALQARGKPLIYAANVSTEAFLNDNGTVGGFTARFCDWLSALFGLRFEPVLLEWDELVDGLASHTVDFTGELTATPARRETYLMTDAIATRMIKCFRLKGSESLSLLAKTRPLRFVFLEGTTTESMVLPHMKGRVRSIIAAEDSAAYAFLKTGEADALLQEDASEAAFNVYQDVVTEDFFPPLYSPVSLSTRNPELWAVISLVQKCLEQGMAHDLVKLYNKGYEDYLRHKLDMMLDGRERRFIRDLALSGLPVRVGFEYDNYPVSFYNEQEMAWQGIAVDIMDEIERISGLRFEAANAPGSEWTDLLSQLESGRIAMVTELMRSEEREGRFLWTSEPYMSDSYALLSRSDFPFISLNEVLYSRVGLIHGSAYADEFRRWFPAHAHSREYGNTILAFDALERGEIELLMAPRTLLLSVTNYMERPGFKANLVLKNVTESYFGFNRSNPVLRSIIDKAQSLVNTENIAEAWTRRVFDYRGKLARAQVPYLIGLSLLMAFVLVLLAILLARRRQAARKLEATVRERTHELEVQTRAAQVASQAKSEFLASMSHEIRTPLNAVLGLGALELRRPHSPDTRANLEKIHTAGGVLLSMINDLLDISKIESGRFELVPVEYDVPSLIHDAISVNAVRAGDKPIDFIVRVDPSLPSALHGDEIRIRQIFNNLLSNAFKYTRKGRVELEVFHSPAPDRTGGDGAQTVWMYCVVKDSGIGIRPEDMDRIFSKYSQVDSYSNRAIEGTGLGLPICRKLVELMDGDIAVRSEYGVGSTFSVRFLQRVADGTPIGRDVAENIASFQMAQRKRDESAGIVYEGLSWARVLVVDDVPINLEVSVGMMEPYGLAVDCVTSGADAVERVRAGIVRYDLIFMDHMMPGMDGIEAVRIIRNEIGTEYARTVPIIALTANAIIGSKEMFLENGFQGFLSKPVDVLAMDAILHAWLAPARTGGASR